MEGGECRGDYWRDWKIGMDMNESMVGKYGMTGQDEVCRQELEGWNEAGRVWNVESGV